MHSPKAYRGECSIMQAIWEFSMCAGKTRHSKMMCDCAYRDHLTSGRGVWT